MKKIGLSLIAAAMLASTQASAALVTQWTVGVSASFLTETVAWEGTGGTQSVSPYSLSWGATPQSSLVLTDYNTTNTVITNGAAVNNLTLTHNNNPITGATLDRVTLRSILTLTPFAPPGTGLPAQTLDFLINFQETPNAANPCANGLPNASGVNINGCADIFVIDRNALNFPFTYDTDGPGGDDPLTYYISFFEITGGLTPLPAAACTAAGATSPCLGFMTPERQSTPAVFAARITSAPVQIPEPGSLALLGIGLGGLAFLRRRKADA